MKWNFRMETDTTSNFTDAPHYWLPKEWVTQIGWDMLIFKGIVLPLNDLQEINVIGVPVSLVLA